MIYNPRIEVVELSKISSLPLGQTSDYNFNSVKDHFFPQPTLSLLLSNHNMDWHLI